MQFFNLMDAPTCNGGNTNNGHLAELFFDPKNRTKICSLIKKTVDRENFAILLQYFNKFLTVTQSTDTSKIANVEKVKFLGQDLMLHHKRSFPFAYIAPSVHQLCAHSHELMELADGEPIGIYSEQGLEAWNKHIRAFKSGPATRARQMSIEINNYDVYIRMFLLSHPSVYGKRRQVYCKECLKVGHTTRSCPKLKQSSSGAIEQDDVSDLYVTE